MEFITGLDFTKYEDNFGNITQEFEVIEYDKRFNGEWVQEKRFRSGRQYYDVKGQLYLKLNNSCIKLNMDFNSETCGRCFKIGSLIENSRKIIGNCELFKIHLSILGTKKLMKQIYADGTSFYSLQDERGNWKVEYGKRNLVEIIEQVKREIEIYSTTKEELRSSIQEEVIKEEKELLIMLMEHI